MIEKLANGEKLDEKYKDHALTGGYIGFRECHITPDWLLVYQIIENELILFLSRTGAHSGLFWLKSNKPIEIIKSIALTAPKEKQTENSER